MENTVVNLMPLKGKFHLTSRWQTASLIVLDAIVVTGAVWVSRAALTLADIVGFVVLLAFRWRLGLYRARFSLSSLDELPTALQAAFVSAGAYALFSVTAWFTVSIVDVVRLAGIGIALGLLRAPLYVMLRDLRRGDLAREPLLLVGGGVVADAISDMADDNPEYGLDLAGRADDLINVNLVSAAREVRAKTVLIAFSRASEAREVFEIRSGLAAGLMIMAVPRYFDLIGPDRADDVVFGLPVLKLGATPRRFGLIIKRLLDFLMAAFALLIFSPLLLVAGYLLKRETGGALLFRQIRIGKNGRSFKLLKLQTMKPVPEATSDTTWHVGDSSDRLGPVGSLLRKTSIDELPQLWNILRGDMSFVGPRPERPYFVERFTEQYPHYEDRMRMPAGLTGLAQIHDLRGDTSIDDRARFDNRYGDHWTLWEDVKIILKTVPKVFKGSGG